MEHNPGWQDYRGRIIKMRDGLRQELLTGTLDKFGNAHDDSKRAALLVLDRMLLLPEIAHTQYEDLLKHKLEQEARAQRTPIHGEDRMSFNLP
jgi:hypothetical protein